MNGNLTEEDGKLIKRKHREIRYINIFLYIELKIRFLFQIYRLIGRNGRTLKNA